MFWRHFGCHRCCYWHLLDKGIDAAKHPIMHRTAAITKRLSGSNVNCITLEKPTSIKGRRGTEWGQVKATYLETVSKTGQESDEACEQCFKKTSFLSFVVLGFSFFSC